MGARFFPERRLPLSPALASGDDSFGRILPASVCGLRTAVTDTAGQIPSIASARAAPS